MPEGAEAGSKVIFFSSQLPSQKLLEQGSHLHSDSKTLKVGLNVWYKATCTHREKHELRRAIHTSSKMKIEQWVRDVSATSLETLQQQDPITDTKQVYIVT